MSARWIGIDRIVRTGCQLPQHPVRQPALGKQGFQLDDREIALIAALLAHDAEQDRKFAVHQAAIDHPPPALGACKIGVHEFCDLRQIEAGLLLAVGVDLLAAERGHAIELALIELAGLLENAGARALLVEWSAAKR